ncbi:hypothetical protein M433DRAFT_538141, partial [Acidomyces richmondensis BFW]
MLIVIYFPYTTHRPQPLDVGCYFPLTIYNRQRYEAFINSLEGLTRMSKKEFFKVFFFFW